MKRRKLAGRKPWYRLVPPVMAEPIFLEPEGEQTKMKYWDLDGHLTTAYAVIEPATGVAIGTNKHTDKPVRLEYDGGVGIWVEVAE